MMTALRQGLVAWAVGSCSAGCWLAGELRGAGLVVAHLILIVHVVWAFVEASWIGERFRVCGFCGVDQ